MARPIFPRVLERDTGLIHSTAPPMSDQVTLCGLTDWLSIAGYRSKGGEPTDKPITCKPCMWFIRFCQGHRLRAGDGAGEAP